MRIPCKNSRSQRILWLLEELGLEYEIKPYQRDAKTMLAPPELRAVHPLGKSPVVSDGGLTLAESGAIIEHLSDRYGSRPFAVGGCLLVAASFVALMLLPVDFPYPVFAFVVLLSGVGSGLFSAPNTATVMSAVPEIMRAVMPMNSTEFTTMTQAMGVRPR